MEKYNIYDQRELHKVISNEEYIKLIKLQLNAVRRAQKQDSFLFCKAGESVSKYKFNMRWDKKELKCACLYGNAACDRDKTCEVLELTLNPFDGAKECMKGRSYKKSGSNKTSEVNQMFVNKKCSLCKMKIDIICC